MVTLASIIPALADCLEALNQGADELEEHLRKHESHRQELVALLQIVGALKAMGQEDEPVPGDEFVKDLKARLLKELQTTTQRGGEEE